LQDVSWNIVEQPRFVAAGRETFQDDRLKFYDTMDACIQAEHPDLLLLSSVLGYLPDPMAFLAEAVARGFDIIVVDITPFSARGRRLTVQRVPPEIYEAAYPAWLLDEAEFLRAFEGKYELVSRYESLPSGYLDLVDARNLGFIFRRV
jgi:putative methyltransferase (TIGR04325 family)